MITLQYLPARTLMERLSIQSIDKLIRALPLSLDRHKYAVISTATMTIMDPAYVLNVESVADNHPYLFRSFTDDIGYFYSMPKIYWIHHALHSTVKMTDTMHS